MFLALIYKVTTNRCLFLILISGCPVYCTKSLVFTEKACWYLLSNCFARTHIISVKCVTNWWLFKIKLVLLLTIKTMRMKLPRSTRPLTFCTEVQELCRLPDPQNGKNAPSREIFLRKEWFSQILCLSLPCHWWFLLVLICSTKVSEKSDMAKSWTARLCRLPQARTFCCSGAYKKVKLKCCGI